MAFLRKLPSTAQTMYICSTVSTLRIQILLSIEDGYEILSWILISKIIWMFKSTTYLKSGSELVDKNSANRYRSTPYLLFLKSEFLSQIKNFLLMNNEKSFCQNVDKTFRFVFNISRENWLVSSNKKNSFILYFLRNAI